MKKSLCVILSVFLCLLLCACGDWSLNYDKTGTSGSWDVAYDTDRKKAFVSAYSWDGSEEGKIITVPDEIEGYRVIKIGGYFGRGLPMPFSVQIYSDQFGKDGYSAQKPDPSLFDKPLRIVELPFTLRLGDNIEKIDNVAYTGYYLDEIEDAIIATHPVFYVEVSEGNRSFYSENGRLYKRNGGLITDLDYSER